jgi:hypothetical protein
MRNHLDGYFAAHIRQETIAQQGILNWNYLQMLREQHRRGKRDTSDELFAILTFNAWYTKYFS